MQFKNSVRSFVGSHNHGAMLRRAAVSVRCHSTRVDRSLAGALILIAAPVFVTARSAHAGKEAVIVPQARMGQPLQGLTIGQRAAFELGKVQYNKVFNPAEGLGPIHNKTSCGNCHSNPVGGPGAQTVTRFGKATKDGFDPMEEFGGSLLQELSISANCFEDIHPDADIITFRVTNGALAYGMVEAVPGGAISGNETSPPHASVSGRVHWVEALEDNGTPQEGTLYAGRFGWKAQVATVLTFSGDASLMEMGITNDLVGTENNPNGILPPELGAPDFCDTVADPEDNLSLGNGVDKKFIHVITDFQRYLAPPPQTPKSGMAGEALFNSAALHCNACHVKSFTTSNDPGLEEAIRNKTIHPYSDWLLHDMGTLGDGVSQGDAGQYEIKTPPLWGLRRRDPILHDGRALGGTFADRILWTMDWHDEPGSEAQSSGAAFLALSVPDQNKVIAFLASLGRPEFDFDTDETSFEDKVEVDDFVIFHACYDGAQGYTPDDLCAIGDINQDGYVDSTDASSFLLAYDGAFRDCNNNGVIDLIDILNGTSEDANNNGLADSCEPTCDADINGSHGADIYDLLGVIAQWGPCPALPSPCGADVVLDRVVNIHDLLAVIAAWGPCAP